MKLLLTNQPRLSRGWSDHKTPDTKPERNKFGYYEENDAHYLKRIEKELKDEQ